MAFSRASVREMVLTYPLLAGMGVTAGENMRDLKGEFSKERFLWKTYGEGVRDALKLQPGREFRMIHRYHQSGQSEILDEWKDYPGGATAPISLSASSSVPLPPGLTQTVETLFAVR